LGFSGSDCLLGEAGTAALAEAGTLGTGDPPFPAEFRSMFLSKVVNWTRIPERDM